MSEVHKIPPARFITVKRKATAEPSLDIKRCKFVASLSSGDKEDVKQFLIESKPDLIIEEVGVEVEDYEEFILKDKRPSFPKSKEIIVCNGIPLVPSSTQPEEDSEEGDYIYDVYLYNVQAEDEDEDIVTANGYREPNDEECSSNDEEHPYNDYPDEDAHDFGERDFYRDWEDDECKEMMTEFEKNVLKSDSDDENDSEDERDHEPNFD